MCGSARRWACESSEQFWRIVSAVVPPAVALIAGGCSQLPGELPSTPGIDPTGVWLPFWVVALASLPLIVAAFYFGLRKIAQPFLKYLLLVYTAFIAAQAGLLWFEGVSITGKFAGNVPWLSRTSSDKPSSVDPAVPATVPDTGGASPATPPARQANFEVQVQVRQAGGELALVTLLFAGIGLAGWRRLHADAETTAATLVRGKLSIGDLHAGLLNGVRGSMAIAWAVRKIQPNQISSAALADQLGSVYFWPAYVWHLGSLDDPLATYVKTYARDAEILTDHLISLADQYSRRAQEAIAQVVKEMPGEDRQHYKVALPEKLLASERQIRGA